MRIKMIDLDTLNAMAWAAFTSLVYFFLNLDRSILTALTSETALELLLIALFFIIKTSAVGFFGGLAGYLSKLVGEWLINQFKKLIKSTFALL
jgi:hypothetical protein